MSITPESVSELLYAEDFGLRMKAINQLRQLDQNTAFKLIQPLINDQNARIRYAAISLLDTIGGVDRDKSLELLRDRLHNDSEADVKAAAADAIAGLKLTEAFPDLLTVYQETSEWLIQFSIIASLGELGDPRGFELLQQALVSDNELLQTSAIGALGELGDPQAIPLLIPFAENPDWQIRHRVAQSLGRLGPHTEEVIDILTKLAQDKADIVAVEAQSYLKMHPQN
jgi:HEAT repeat protein